jgi:hypothetical protein
VPGFFLGGLIDRAMSKVDEWLGQGARFAVNSILTPAERMIAAVVPAPELANRVATSIPRILRERIGGWAARREAAAGGGGGPVGAGGYARALAWARTQAGKPYLWGGVGPAGYDCSGFMSAILNVIRGRNPHQRLFATGSAGGSTLAGLTRNKPSPFRIGVFKGSPGHTAGTLNGVNVESRGSDGVVIGSRAAGWNWRRFTMNYGLARGGPVEGRLGDAAFDLYDKRILRLIGAGAFDGGGVASGRGLLPKNVLQPERVLDPRTTVAFERLVGVLEQGGKSGRGDTVNLYTPDIPAAVRALDEREARRRALYPVIG